MFAKGEEGNVQIKMDIILTYSETESKVPVFHYFSNEEFIFRREDTNVHVPWFCREVDGKGGAFSRGRAWAKQEPPCSIFGAQVWR